MARIVKARMARILLLLTLGSLAPVVVSAQTPSLADVARQERERQKNLSAKSIFTNETLGIPVEKSPAPAPEKPAADKPAAKADQPAADVLPHDEAGWRDAFRKAREEVKASEERARVMRLELDQLNFDFLNRNDIFNKEGQMVPLLNFKKEEVAAADKKAEDARRNVTQLEDSLRKSGDPIGWSR